MIGWRATYPDPRTVRLPSQPVGATEGVTIAPFARRSSVLLHFSENFGVGSIVTVVVRLLEFTTALIVTVSTAVAALEALT
jgi:hypothetical protein